MKIGVTSMEAASTLVRDTPRETTFKSPRLWLAAAVFGATLVFGGIFLAISLVQGPRGYTQLDQNIVTSRAALAANQALLAEDLAPALTLAEADLGKVEAAFPQTVHTTPFITQVYEMAFYSGVEILNVQNRKSKEVTVDKHKYVTVPFSITAKGDVARLGDFIGALEKVQGHTLVVKSVLISGEGDKTTLAAELDIYTRP